MESSAVGIVLYTQTTVHPAAGYLRSRPIYDENNHRKILDRAADDNMQAIEAKLYMRTVGWGLMSETDRRQNISNLWSRSSAHKNNRTSGATTT